MNSFAGIPAFSFDVDTNTGRDNVQTSPQCNLNRQELFANNRTSLV